ncbi:MAG: VWA domain-containing protein [Spongiibacteraceae bacterium]
MNILLAQFHWLRPWWLLALIPALLLAIMLWKRQSSAANWRAAIAPDLIDYLLEPTQQIRSHWPWLLFAGWLLSIIALAGPTWEKLPQPVLQKRDGLVIVLDLSLSMYAEDIKPSRLDRARFKIIDLLKQRKEGLTGLVVYSGDAHIVSPLTDDTATIENLVPSLAPAIMPSFGSDAAAGIDTALKLLHNSGFERGKILLISDEITEDDIGKIAAQIDGKRWQLGIIGVGSEQGAPIPLPQNANQSGFLKQNDGTIAIAQLHRNRFIQLASKVNGRYQDMRVDDRDIEQLLSTQLLDNDTARTVEREFDQWRERGPQLVLLLLPLAALAFRRGWLLLIFLIPYSMPSQASELEWKWRDLWQRPDQQAQQDFNAGNSKVAAEKFNDPQWRAAAQYRSGDYSAAAQSLQNIDTADSHYNRGNALAHDGKLEEAISAYNAALQKNPAMADAKANRELVEKLLKQQQKNQPDKNQQSNNKKDESQQQQSQADSSRDQQSSSSQDNAQSQDQSQSQKNGDASQSQPSKPSDNSQQGDQNNNSQQAASGNANTQNRNEKSMQQQSISDREKQPQDKSSSAQAMQNGDQPAPEGDGKQAANANRLTPEQQMQQRATEQWLQQVPDDPAGLLRRKFIYESQQREREPQRDGKPLW